MNFFEAQTKARRATSVLIILFLLGVAGVMVLTHLFLMLVVAYMEHGEVVQTLEAIVTANTDVSILTSGGIVLALIVGGSWYKLAQLSAGGRVVAEALQGSLIPRETANPNKQQLLNVVDEMALASGIPAPPVYVIKSRGINAFAAGLTYDDAVIGVTQGLLDALERQELQGVIAHEFSHIFNGDMKLNSRVSGLLHGMILIGLIGRNILNLLHNTRIYPSRGSTKKGNPLFAAYLVGIGFSIIGFIGTWVGELIKAYISRQREYLADASAVQYTRYPTGIANALKKIGSAGSALSTNNASAYSHFYFADGVKGFWDHLFSTHPKLDDRIYRIDPRWDGAYLPIPKKPMTAQPSEEKPSKKEVFEAVTTAAVLDAMEAMGHPESRRVDQARQVLDAIPKPILSMAQHPMSAQAVVLALLTDRWIATRNLQWICLKEHSKALFQQTKLAVEYVHDVQEGLRLPLLQQCITALKTMSAPQYESFRHCVKHFMDADDTLSLFEWTLEHLMLRPLDRHYGHHKAVKETHSHLGAVRSEVECFISKLARTQYDAPRDALNAFDATMKHVGATALRYQSDDRQGYADFNHAVEVLEASKMGVRKRVLDMTIEVLNHDGIISAVDMELLHAIALTLRLPLPQVIGKGR